MSRYKQRTIIVGQMINEWNTEKLIDFLREELVFQGNKKGYFVDVGKTKIVEKKNVIFVESICQYVGKVKALTSQWNKMFSDRQIPRRLMVRPYKT